jgi:isopenicillin-N N-acyltransferase-like protein
MSHPFPFIHVEGPARERGRQYGKAAGQRVVKSLEIYTGAFAQNGLQWPQVKELAQRFLTVIDQYDHDFLEEIYGIAEGAEQEVEAIVALNARTELMFWQGPENQAKTGPSDECTGAIVTPEATADGHMLHGQNWDWRPDCIDSAVVVRHVPEKGPSFLTFTEAGLLSRCGMNSAGLSVTGNFLQSDQDFGRSGIPIPFIRRRILTSSSFAHAVGSVIRSPRAFSSNHMVSDAQGEAINLESAPDEVFWIHPEGGILVHSNHFKDPASKVKLKDTGIGRFPDSLYRDRRVEAHLYPKRGQITVEDLKVAFKDHYGKPDSVCRHATARSNGTVIGTVASIIMDVTAGRMWIAPGPVCENDFTEYTLVG